ncbi:hypothetical protein CASFOL_035742 [Castilleja foliolosa]|uniref:Protein EI24 homolog n=1 Tax=Castilleja foliolosa TaxID=1961234 RepID=A0ABD3BVV3_9LAMI
MDTTIIRGFLGNFKPKLKQASLLWLEGFREACCLHRVIIYCHRSRELAKRTGQVFLLNGFIFLGSKQFVFLEASEAIWMLVSCDFAAFFAAFLAAFLAKKAEKSQLTNIQEAPEPVLTVGEMETDGARYYILVLRSFVIPTLQWVLPDKCPSINSEESCPFGGIFRFYSVLRLGLIQLFYLLWFYPMYISSFILSTLWYNDIAKYGFFAIENQELSGTKDTNASDNNSTDLEGVMVGIAEQVYSVLLLSFFFLEVYVTGFIPFIGKAVNFLLLSWMYAYYCFEYKWNYSGLSLDKRLDFFESNWLFFAGFGSPCVLAVFFFSPLVSYGVMAILYPLFVLTATGSEADKVIASQRKNWKGAGLGRVPIFFSADYLSMKVLSFFPIRPREQLHDQKAL